MDTQIRFLMITIKFFGRFDSLAFALLAHYLLQLLDLVGILVGNQNKFYGLNLRILFLLPATV
jgi:hypothetical protein